MWGPVTVTEMIDDAAEQRLRPRRWPWAIVLLVVAVTSLTSLHVLRDRENDARRAQADAAAFATQTEDMIRSLQIVTGELPRAQWTPAVSSLLRQADAVSHRELVGLREVTADPELDELEWLVERLAGLAGTQPDLKVIAAAWGHAARVTVIAQAVADRQERRASSIARQTQIGQAAVLVVAAILVWLLLRVSERLLVRQAAGHHRHLKHLADHDPLTGLPNRRRFDRDVQEAQRRATSEHPVQVLVCDLDGFKAYNDRHGHAAGDELLTAVAHALAACVGEHGVVYRIGGDESGHARLAAALGRSGCEVSDGTVTTSVGAAVIPGEADSVRAALQLADQRMYAAKARGRTRPAAA
jgi:GGDEF domain-containing protein